MMLKYRDRIDWNSSKMIAQSVSLGHSLSADHFIRVQLQWKHPKFWLDSGGVLKMWLSAYNSCNISETWHDVTLVTFIAIEDQ